MASRRGFADSPIASLRQLAQLSVIALVAGAVLLGTSACTHVESTHTPPPEPPPEPPQKDAVAIVVSSNAPAYLAVARALAQELDRDYLRYSLDTASAPILRDVIDRAGHPQVITIGRAAALAMRPVGPERMLYCQVFYDAELRDAGFRGVAAQPPFAMQLDTWTRLEPGLRRIGVVAGSQSAPLVRSLTAAADAYGIDVHHEQVTSDKQALFVFQRLIPEIDGYLFLPDTAVLSPTVIRKMMRYGVKHDKSMLVYSPVLFELGASLLIGPEPGDVARQLMALLDAEEPAAGRRPLTEIAAAVPPGRQVALVAALTDRSSDDTTAETAQ